MHLSDIRRQSERALENVTALLSGQGAKLSDMAYLIVYVRNITEAPKVMDAIAPYIPKDIPLILVKGAVCRPSWLVEIEGVGFIEEHFEYPEFL